MPRFAAFDVGTNTVLMAVAERDAAGRLAPVAEREEITRLGEGLARAGALRPAAIERTVEALARFADEARALGAEKLVAGATSAARDAWNGAELVRLARERAGVEVEILSGEEEANLTFRAVQEDFGGEGRPLVAIDVGGGSTEIVAGGPTGAPLWRRSVDVGSVRLTEKFVTGHPIPLQERRAIRSVVRSALEGVPAAAPESLAVAVAATATTLAGLARQALPRRSCLSPILRALADLSLEERLKVPGLDPRRADVICAGGWVLLEVLDHLGLDEWRASDRGVRWGLLLERFGR